MEYSRDWNGLTGISLLSDRADFVNLILIVI